MNVRYGALLLLAFALAGCRREGVPLDTVTAGDPQQPVSVRGAVRFGVGTQAEIGGGAVHTYSVDLEAGTFVHLTVEQQGADVAMVLADPEGAALITVDSPNDREGPEHLWMTATDSGAYRLEIRAAMDAVPGRYAVRILTLRPASEVDHRVAEAARELERARGLRGDDLYAAAAAFDRLLPVWQESGEPLGEALTHEYLGQVYGRLKDTARQRSSYKNALAIHRVTGDRREEARFWHKIGTSHLRAYEYPEAFDAYQQALELWGEATDELTARIYNDAAVYAKRTGQAQLALRFYGEALSRWQQLGRRGRSGEATTCHNLGELHFFLGDKARARDHFERALELRRSAGDLRGMASTLTGLGKVDAERGSQTERALERLTRALKLRRRADDRAGEAVTLTSLGNVELRRGDLDAAEDAYTQALTIFAGRSERCSEAFVRVNLGQVRQARGEVEEALREYETARIEFAGMGMPRGEAAALFGMAGSERLRDRLDVAEARVTEAIELVERLRAAAGDDMLRTTYLASKQSYYDFLIALIMQRHRRDPTGGHAARGLAAAERRRARNLLELLREAVADLRRGVDPALADAERRVWDRIRARELQRTRQPRRGAAAEDLGEHDRALRGLLAEAAEIRAGIRYRSPRYANLTEPPTIDLDAIRALLDPETLLLEYALGEERSFLWAVRHDGFTSHELPARERVEELAENVHRLMRRSHLEEYRLQAILMAASLGRMLLGPVADQLDMRRIVVLAEGALHYVPFAALPVPPDSETSGTVPLVDGHEVLALPSASVLAVLRRELARRRPAPRAVAVVADPVFARDDPRLAAAPPAGPASATLFRRLPFTRHEAESILARVAEGEGFAALGFDASRETVMSGELRDYRIVHFATHARIHPRQPELSKVVLAQFDARGRELHGYLTEQEIYGLELPAELVVLSACETALGTKIRGEGLVGLTRAFFYAGTARLLVSLWGVDDQATAALMDRFYAHLLDDGLPPAAALRDAQLWMRDNGWPAPFYWAGFVLQGEWR